MWGRLGHLFCATLGCCVGFGCLGETFADEPAIQFAADNTNDVVAAQPFELLDGEPAVPVSEASLAEVNDQAEAKKKAAALKKKKEALQKAVAGAYAPIFYNNNFSYLSNPLYKDHYLGENFKQLDVGCWKLDLGGQYRMRQHSERQMRSVAGPVTAFGGLTGVNDDFLLQRTRLFANLVSPDQIVRIYAEGIDAQESFQSSPARIIEQDPADMLNLFADVKLMELGDGDVTIRGGRQELLYGSERLISPLDWANTRRTFQGVKTYWSNKNWSFDAFFTRPVIVDPNGFDSPDYHQEMSGFWLTNRAIKNQTFDFYYLIYRNASSFQPVKDSITNHYLFDTVGSRWQGSKDAWLWDFEGGVQYGTNTDGTAHAAGFWTTGAGYKWEKAKWKPTLWGYYDWSSGSNATGAGNGFNQAFPLVHKYLGFMDLYGRSNIETPNVLLTLQPHKKLQLLTWYYYFFLTNGNDTPYNVNSRSFNNTAVPGSRDLGHEIDFVATYTINPRQTLLFGYSHFFTGAYYRTTPGVPTSNDADFFYTQYQINF